MIIDIIDKLVWICLGLSTLIGVSDFVGLLPNEARKKLRLNKVDDTLMTLKELGVNIDKYKRNNSVVDFPKICTTAELEKHLENALEKVKINKAISVGHYRVIKMDYYYDIIGHSCDSLTAKLFAQYLSAYFYQNAKDPEKIKSPCFDFVVTPKAGSPILGYEFANLIKKPFVLHESVARFKDNLDDFRANFNCSSIPPKGSTALIVDDSTTGGRMVVDTIESLRDYGYNVYDCLVVFAPQNKDAKNKLKENDVNLISIVETHKD